MTEIENQQSERSSELGRYDPRKRRTLRRILQDLQVRFEGLRYCELESNTGLSPQALSDGKKELLDKNWIQEDDVGRYHITASGRDALRSYFTLDDDYSAPTEELMTVPVSAVLRSNFICTQNNYYGSMSGQIVVYTEMPTAQQIEKFDRWYNDEYLPWRCKLLDKCPVPFSEFTEISVTKRLTHCPTCGAQFEKTSQGPKCPKCDK